MNIEINDFNNDFINQVRDFTGIPETNIVNNIISYYRAIKTVRRQHLTKEEYIEFGKSELGLMESEDLQLYLMTYLKKQEVSLGIFWDIVKRDMLKLIDYVERNEKEKALKKAIELKPVLLEAG